MVHPHASRSVRACVAIGLAAAMLGPLPGATRADETGKPVGDQLYATAFKDLQDQTSSLGQFKGKVLVMYFWATWCVPCRIETPNLVKLDAAYKAKGKDVQVVGIALDSGDKVRDFVKDNNVTYPIFFGGREAIALGKALGNEGGAIPFTVVIGKDGTLAKAFKGDLPNAELEKIIDPLIG